MNTEGGPQMPTADDDIFRIDAEPKPAMEEAAQESPFKDEWNIMDGIRERFKHVEPSFTNEAEYRPEGLRAA